MKNFFLFILVYLSLLNNSFACGLLNVPIGTPVSTAVQTFEFLTNYDAESVEEDYSIKYLDYAIDYCEDGGFIETEIEVIVFDSKIAAINLVSSDEKNEVYNFTKNRINDPGIEAQKKDWQGIIDLSVGDLIIIYGKYLKNNIIYESLEITNSDMRNYVYGEHVIEGTL